MSLAKDVKVKSDDRATRFLMGELSENERLDVEERFLNDNEFFEEILAAEDALVDQHLLGLLSEEETTRAKFLLESGREQRRNVEFTRELIALLRQSGLSEKPRATTAPISVGRFKNMPRIPYGVSIGLTVIVLFLGSWIVYLHFKERNTEAKRIAAERSNNETIKDLNQEREKSRLLAQELERERQERLKTEDLLVQSLPGQPPKITSLLLTPTTFERESESNIKTLRATTERIRLQLAVNEGAQYDRYSLLITTFSGNKIWSSDSLRANQIRHGKLVVTFPGSLFTYEDYKLELKGLSESGEFMHIADYTFKVR